MVVHAHEGGGDAAAEASDLGAGDEVSAQAWAEVVDAQIDGADAGEALEDLGGGFVGVLAGDGQGEGEACGCVEGGGDDAAVEAAVEEVADEFGAHVQAQARVVGVEGIDLEAEELVEAQALLPQLGEGEVEAGLLGAGDRVIFTSGEHMETKGATNTLRLLEVGEDGRAEGLGEL